VLSAEQNERLTRVGPGAPCGELMRRYWIPIAPFAQLLEKPVRKVRVLGEDLVLYKDTSGRLGLIGDRCLHRLVDMQWGIPDDRGLRCPYHGWLYGETGECLERPLEANPAGKIARRLKAYPVRELGGLIFAYLGPMPAPALPHWDLFVWPNCVRQIAINVLDCNWLQCQENTGDPAHSVWAHGHFFKHILEQQGQFEERAKSDEHTLRNRIKWGTGIKAIHARETKYGFEKALIYSRELGADSDYQRRHGTVIFPFYTQTGTAGAPRSEFQIRVPMDDTHTYDAPQIWPEAPGNIVKYGLLVEPDRSVQLVKRGKDRFAFNSRGRTYLEGSSVQDCITLYGHNGKVGKNNVGGDSSDQQLSSRDA
jgi:5,5'-dehydrodivanillate O-demethylase